MLDLDDVTSRVYLAPLVKEAIEEAEAAGVIKDMDVAASALAIEYARTLDETWDDCIENGTWDVWLKCLNIAGPNLNRTLTALGLTPVSRGEMATKDEKADVVDAILSKRKRPA